MSVRQTRMAGQIQDKPDVIPLPPKRHWIVRLLTERPGKWFVRWVILEIVVFVLTLTLLYVFAP